MLYGSRVFRVYSMFSAFGRELHCRQIGKLVFRLFSGCFEPRLIILDEMLYPAGLVGCLRKAGFLEGVYDLPKI